MMDPIIYRIAYPPTPVRSRGFTLIEISIVLVIIGLIVGGILVGRDLIYAAEIRATINQAEQFNLATNAFRLKYNCLPGDCPSASSLGFGNTNGTGNGLIGANGKVVCQFGNALCSPADIAEYTNFWAHLSMASLIPTAVSPLDNVLPLNLDFGFRAGLDSPPTRLRPTHDIFTSTTQYTGWTIEAGASFIIDTGIIVSPMGAHLITLGSEHTFPNAGQGYAPFDIWSIDSKIDDGFPLSGIVRTTTSQLNATTVLIYNIATFDNGATNPSCIRRDTTPYQYNVLLPVRTGDPLRSCGLLIKAAF